MTAWKEQLVTIYFNPQNPGAFAGPDKVQKVFKQAGYNVSKHRIRKWLQDQDAYSLQKPVKAKFKRARVITTGIDDLLDMDLADVSNLKSYNDGIHYLLIVIDVFSRFLWVVPLENKQHNTIVNVLKSILNSSRKPYRVRSDKGSEFKNRWVKKYLTENAVKQQFTQNETKANYAERVIRSIKALMYRYFTYKQTYKYRDILQDLVFNYNHRPHRSLNGRAPADVNKDNEVEIWNELFIKPLKQPKKSKTKKYKSYNFRKGDFVRMTHLTHPFQRDYQEKWTEEIFIVKDRYYFQGIPVYKLTDYAKDPIDGIFYQNELQRVEKGREDIWRIDKVLKRRRRRGQEELFVSFVGWPKKFNMWLKSEDIQDV